MSAVSKESEDEAEAAGTSSMMESSMMEGEEYYNPDTTVAWSEKVSGGEQLCRICAGPNEYLIPIFSGEGLEHQLGMKIEKHLPIQVLEHDKLPVQVCYQCASTLIAWHDLVVGCVEAEKKLRQLYQQQNVEEEEEEDDFGDDDRTELFADPVDSEMAEDPLEPSTSTSTATRSTRSPRKKSVTRAKPKLKMTLVKTPAALPKSPPKLLQPKEEQVEADPATERLPPPTHASFTAFHSALRDMSKHDPRLFVTLARPRQDNARYCDQCGDAITSGDFLQCHTCDPLLAAKPKLEPKLEPMADDTNAWSDRESACDSDGSDTSVEKRSQEVANRSNSSKRAQFMCSICDRSFIRNNYLQKHLRTHSPSLDVSLRSFQAADTAVKHESQDMELDDNEYNEGASSAKPAKRKRKNVYHCEHCGKNFTLKDSFFRHARIHSGEKPFTCHICGKQFRDSGGLARHLKDVHAGIKNFPCELCGRSFASKATREDHRRTHTGERPYVCHACGKAFKSKASLYTHGKIHTDSFPHPCTYCEKRFRRRQELLAHVTTHTGEKPHGCDSCDKSFRVRGELLRHRLVHSDSKPHVCSECGLSFRQKRYLKNHEKTRHEIRDSDAVV